MAAFEKFLTARSARIDERRQDEADKRSMETHKADLKYKGLLGEKITDEMRREKTKQEKVTKINALTGEYMGASDEAARTATGAALTALDPSALTTAQGLYSGQQDRQKAAQQQQTDLFTNSYQVAQGLPDEQRAEAYQGMVGKAVQMGIATEEEADQLSVMARDDPKSFESVIEDLLGMAETDPKLSAAGLQSFINSKTGDVVRIDTTTPEGREEFLGLGSDYIKAPTKTETGEPGAFAGGPKEIRDFRAFEISTRNTLDTIESTLELLKTTPDAFTSVASLAGMASGLATEAEAAGRALGFQIPAAVRDLNNYASEFEDLGIQGSRAQGALLDLALAYASAIGLGEGRALTEKDVKRALDRVGAGGLKTPKARVAMMKDVQAVITRNFINSYEVLQGKPYEGDLGGRIRAAPLEIGTERGGYTFTGGDPKDKANWEKDGG